MTAAAWFFDLSVGVFPTVNKIPAVGPKGSSWKDYRCTRAQAARFREYAVPLGRCSRGYLAVADTDSDPPKAWAVANLPTTPFIVETGPYHNGTLGRGQHSYYRITGPMPSYMHRDGHTIEFRNAGLYVVGPGSVRPDGVRYKSSDWSWRWEDIPFFPADFLFDDGSCGRFSAAGTPAAGTLGEPYEFPDVVRGGRRHHELFRLLRSFKGRGIDREATREIVHLANENRCDPSLTEDATFEEWFNRAWDNPDRPIDRGTTVLSGVRGLRGL